MAQAGAAAPNLDGDAHRVARLQYRQGLDLLADSVAAAPADKNLRPNMQHLLTANDMPDVGLPRTMQQLEITQQLPSIPAAFGQLVRSSLITLFCLPGGDQIVLLLFEKPTNDFQVPQRLVYGPSRYREEFEELSVLGRGGYGIVYHCKHRLDGNEYAVKKVPVSIPVGPV